MTEKKITIKATVLADKQKVWDYYTLPEHITKWNFADPSWHCPFATNDFKVGGRYVARMEAKDGSFGFDFEVVYSEIKVGKSFSYGFDGRTVNVTIENINNQTEIVVEFDPEKQNPIELQRAGWQSILNNFKNYTESN